MHKFILSTGKTLLLMVFCLNTGYAQLHHGHEHLVLMPEAFHLMQPFLYGVNLNGMNPGGPKILPLGQGTEDVKILQMIADSGYDGPIGIIGHVDNEDEEIVLKRNLAGLKKLLLEIGETETYKTY